MAISKPDPEELLTLFGKKRVDNANGVVDQESEESRREVCQLFR